MLIEIIGSALLLVGLFFLFAGVIGIIRLPDAYSRLHASGKVGTLGLFGLSLGAGFFNPALFPRLLLLTLFFLLTAPAASHAIAIIGHRRAKQRIPGNNL